MILNEKEVEKIINEIILVEKTDGIIYSDNFIDRLRELSDERLLEIAFKLSLENIPFSKIEKRQINAYGIDDLTQFYINEDIINISSGSDKNDSIIDFLIITHDNSKRKEIIKEYEELKKVSKEGFSYRVVVVNNLNDYNNSVHGMRVRDIIFTDISQVSQEMYEVLRTRLVR